MEVSLKALKELQTEALRGKFFRYIRTRYAHEPLSLFGSLQNGGRYNVAGSFGALYLGFDHQTCQAEVTQGILANLPIKSGAFTLWAYQVKLQAIVRLDEQPIQKKLGLTPQDITIPGNHWTASAIGEPLFQRGDVEGLVAPSAQLAGSLCLDVYLDRLTTLSTVTPVKKLGTWPSPQNIPKRRTGTFRK